MPQPTTEAIESLKKAFAPKVSTELRSKLEEVIREAQAAPPTDRVRFVHDINQMLDWSHLRLKVPNAGLVRLSVNRNSIQFRTAEKGTIGFSKQSEFVLVDASSGIVELGAEMSAPPAMT